MDLLLMMHFQDRLQLFMWWEIVLADRSVLHVVRHNNKTGQILGASGLRGLGIAFPEEVTDSLALQTLES